jgi:hypothetical protein
MSYRDDRDADRARIEALEAELAAARGKIDELEGRRQQALVLAGGQLAVRGTQAAVQTRWLGAPLDLELTRELAGAFPVERFEELIVRIRSISPEHGFAEVMRMSMSWQAGTGNNTISRATVLVAVRDGRTTLTVRDKLGPLVGAMYGGFGGGLGVGGVAIPIVASLAIPLAVPVVVLGWLGGVFYGTRRLFQRAAHRRATRLLQLFEALERDIAAALATTT